LLPDEVPQFLTSVGLAPKPGDAGWFGYIDGSGQEVAIFEHEQGGALTVDCGLGRGVAARGLGRAERGLATTRDGQSIDFALASGTKIALVPDGSKLRFSATLPDNGKNQLTALLVPIAPGG